MYLKFFLCSDEGVELVAGTMPVHTQPFYFAWEAALGCSLIERKSGRMLDAFKVELTPKWTDYDFSEVSPGEQLLLEGDR